jgi:hypothetical protein
MSSNIAPAADWHLRLYRYWAEKRGTRRMPARADIDPADLREMLPNLALLEVTATGFRYRLVGTRVAEDLGRDMTGAVAGAYAKGMSFGDKIVAMFDQARRRAMPQFSTGEYRSPQQTVHWVSRLLLPLGVDGATVDMILMCRVAGYAPGPEAGRDWLTGASGRKMQTVEVASLAELEALCAAWAAAGRS